VSSEFDFGDCIRRDDIPLYHTTDRSLSLPTIGIQVSKTIASICDVTGRSVRISSDEQICDSTFIIAQHIMDPYRWGFRGKPVQQLHRGRNRHIPEPCFQSSIDQTNTTTMIAICCTRSFVLHPSVILIPTRSAISRRAMSVGGSGLRLSESSDPLQPQGGPPIMIILTYRIFEMTTRKPETKHF
jgi:hypothetical protein